MSTPSPGWPFPSLAPYNLAQQILPWSFSGVTVNYQGDVTVERNVIETVASYGKQLGILTDAVLKLAGQSLHPKPGEPEEDPIARLHAIAGKIEELKNVHKTSLLKQAQEAMDRLAAGNPASASYIASKYIEAKE